LGQKVGDYFFEIVHTLALNKMGGLLIGDIDRAKVKRYRHYSIFPIFGLFAKGLRAELRGTP
jgi:hypothetical protein